MATLNWASQQLDAESALVFATVGAYPEVTIPLYIQDYPMPVRTQKFQEINTPEISTGGYSGSTHAGFFGAQDQLQTQMGGFLITPMSSTAWTPTANGKSSGTSLGLTGMNNAELILAYMEGRMSQATNGARIRKDPSQFIDPYGNVYTSVYILAFEGTFTVTAKKQTFTMSLRLGA